MDTTIAILPGGGIGDMVISLPIVDFILDMFPNSEVDVCRTGKAANYEAIVGPERAKRFRKIYDLSDPVVKYGASFELHEFVHLNFTSEFLEASSQFSPVFMKNQFRMAALNNMQKAFPYGMNQIGNVGNKRGLTRVTLPQWTLGFEAYKEPRIEHIARAQYDQKYITINDGWNTSGIGFRTTKAWEEARWRQFVASARADGITVVQLGSPDMGVDYEVDIQLRGKTTFLEGLEWLKGSMCHIDIEGGLVHAATAMDVPCVVLHGPTNFEFFSYPQNVNLKHGACQNCWHMTPDWGQNCMISNHSCMKHDPEIVLQAVKKLIH